MVNSITEHIDIWTTAQTQKNNVGRGHGKNSNGQSPHGIKKLRELILELAVHGKLVPQDPKDEPASVLLEKVAKEKAQLIKAGKIKKQKLLPDISEDEKPFELPVGWEFVRFGNATFNRDAERVPLSVEERRGRQGKFDYYGASGVIDSIDDYLFEEPFLLIGEDGANLINRSTPIAFMARGKYWVNNHAHVIDGLTEELLLYICLHINAISLEPYITGTAQPKMNQAKMNSIILALPPLAEQHRIVAKVAELMALCGQLEQQQTDSNATHQTLVETLLATLTNAANQKEFAKAWQRIANHFDTLFTTEQSIDHLKQTILQLAIMGKLVPQDPTDLPAPVRASHADGPQSGKFFVYALECEDKSIYIGQTNDILNRWKEHATGKGADWTKKHPPQRLVHWEEYNSREEAITREKELKTGFGRKWLKRELAASRTRQAGEPAIILLEKISAEKARLIKEGKIKKQKPLPGISEDEKIFELPVGWAWSRLDDLALRSEAGWSPKCESVPREGENWGVLKVSAITWGRYNPNENKALPSSLEPRAEYEVMPGDFLISRANTSELVARAVVVAKDAPARLMMSDKTIRFVFSLEVSVEFVNLANSSRFSRDYYASVAGGTSSSMKNVSRNQIRTLVIALPPILEQLRIVAKVDELMVICDTLKSRLNIAQTTQAQLADALVEQAVA